jgi:hypothetical protein
LLCLFGEIPAFHDDSSIDLFCPNRILDDFLEPLLQLLRAGTVGIQFALSAVRSS